jgi:hypothetical protein
VTDELEPDRVRSLHEQLERRLAAEVDIVGTWARVHERIAASKVVRMPMRRRSRRIVVLAIAAALVLTGSALAGMRQQAADAGHPGPGSAHPPALSPTTDGENGTGPGQGTRSNEGARGTAREDADDPAQNEAPGTDGRDGDQSESSPDGDQGTDGGGDPSGATDQGDHVDQGSDSGDQIQDPDQTDGGTDSLTGDGQNEG